MKFERPSAVLVAVEGAAGPPPRAAPLRSHRKMRPCVTSRGSTIRRNIRTFCRLPAVTPLGFRL